MADWQNPSYAAPLSPAQIQAQMGMFGHVDNLYGTDPTASAQLAGQYGQVGANGLSAGLQSQYGTPTGNPWGAVAGDSAANAGRTLTSSSGGSYIGGMSPQQPTQDMSSMWGGYGTSGTSGSNPYLGDTGSAAQGSGYSMSGAQTMPRTDSESGMPSPYLWGANDSLPQPGAAPGWAGLGGDTLAGSGHGATGGMTGTGLMSGFASLFPGMNKSTTSPFAQYQNPDGSYKPGYEYLYNTNPGTADLNNLQPQTQGGGASPYSYTPPAGSGPGLGSAGPTASTGAPPQNFAMGSPGATSYPTLTGTSMPGYGGTSTTPAASGSPYDSQINALYASIGKTPDMIDQQGRDYWTQQLQAGNDISGQFKNSAASTYANMLNGQTSPYQSQNIAGYNSLTGSPGATGGTGTPSTGGTTSTSTSGAPSLNAYTQSPYLKDVANGITTQFNNQLTRNALPAIRSGAIATGGYGGQRDAIAQGLAVGDSQNGLASALAGLYNNDYQQQMGRNLSQYGLDQNYALGGLNSARNYALGNQGQMLNYDTNQRQLDQSGARLGADIYNLGVTGQWGPINNMTGAINPYTGNGSTTTNQGGGAMGAAGGALGAAQLAQILGLFK